MSWLKDTFKSAAGSLTGGLLSGAFGSHSARQQMQFQKKMSNTSHQRQVADLRAAGLNPMLSANSGASSPGGAMSTMGDPITPAISTAREQARTKQEIENMKETNKAIQDNAALTRQQNQESQAREQQTRQAMAFLPLQIEAQLEQAHSAARYHRFLGDLSRLQVGKASLENAIYSGPGGREILIASMGPAASATEVARRTAKAVQEKAPTLNDWQRAIQSLPNIFRPPLRHGRNLNRR